MVFRESIKERFSKAVIESEIGSWVAVRNMYVVISNSQDTLFTDIVMIEINIEFGLAHWKRILNGLSQQNINFNWTVFQ